MTQRSGTGINVNGLRAQAGNVTIDGVEANEASNPTPTNNVFRINPDNVEEFKVTTSNPTPEEGKNSGLNVSIATRSGTNTFHGSLVEYFRNNDLNSNEFYANAQGQPRANLKANQYGFEVGGPIHPRIRRSSTPHGKGKRSICRKPSIKPSVLSHAYTPRRRCRVFSGILCPTPLIP